MRLSPEVMAVHVASLDGEDDEGEQQIRDRWAEDIERPARNAGLKAPRLILLKSQYRLMYAPLLLLVRELEKEYPGRIIAALLPEIVKTSWWQFLLHTHRARRVRAKLLRFGGPRLVVVSLPLYLEQPGTDETVTAEAAEGQCISRVPETVG